MNKNTLKTALAAVLIAAVVTLADSARLTFTDVCLITPITVRGGNGAGTGGFCRI